MSMNGKCRENEKEIPAESRVTRSADDQEVRICITKL
jgi:hypothetical protein